MSPVDNSDYLDPDGFTADNYWLQELVAVEWNPKLAYQFPNADHTNCRQELFHDGNQWVSYNPVKCRGWHCPFCGEPTNIYGHHSTRNPPCKEPK
jgi:hypothetical protein